MRGQPVQSVDREALNCEEEERCLVEGGKRKYQRQGATRYRKNGKQGPVTESMVDREGGRAGQLMLELVVSMIPWQPDQSAARQPTGPNHLSQMATGVAAIQITKTTQNSQHTSKTACSNGPNSGSGKPSQNRLRSKGPP